MPILLAAAFWLIVTVHGEIKYRSGPMTGDACALQMAFHIMQARRIAAEGTRIVVDGRVVTLGDLEIECKPGERAA